MKIADFKPKQEREVYHVHLPRGCYLTYQNDYSGQGWGWTWELHEAAAFDKKTAAKVAELAAKHHSVAMDFPATPSVVDSKGNFVPTTKEELERAKNPKTVCLEW